VAAVSLLLSLAGCTGRDERDSKPAAGVVEMSKTGRQMPAITLSSPLSDQTVISSDSFQDKVILVSFFASWCRSCLEEIPLLKKLYSRFSDRGFVLVAMAVDRENVASLKNLIREQDIDYPVLLADEAVKKDFGGITILPTMFLVDRKGKFIRKIFRPY
jgi:peroxiredoxin